MDYTLQLTLLTGISFGIFVMLIGIGHQLECIAKELRKGKCR